LWDVGELFEGSNRPVQTVAFRFEFGQNPWDIQRGFSSVPEILAEEKALTDKPTSFVPFSEQAGLTTKGPEGHGWGQYNQTERVPCRRKRTIRPCGRP
jgi:hypothetical protein